MTFHCHKLQTSSSVTFNLANQLHVFRQSTLFNTRKIKFLFAYSFFFRKIFILPSNTHLILHTKVQEYKELRNNKF